MNMSLPFQFGLLYLLLLLELCSGILGRERLFRGPFGFGGRAVMDALFGDVVLVIVLVLVIGLCIAVRSALGIRVRCSRVGVGLLLMSLNDQIHALKRFFFSKLRDLRRMFRLSWCFDSICVFQFFFFLTLVSILFL